MNPIKNPIQRVIEFTITANNQPGRKITSEVKVTDEAGTPLEIATALFPALQDMQDKGVFDGTSEFCLHAEVKS